MASVSIDLYLLSVPGHTFLSPDHFQFFPVLLETALFFLHFGKGGCIRVQNDLAAASVYCCHLSFRFADH